MWNHFRDKLNFVGNEIVSNPRLNKTNSRITQSFESETKAMGGTPANSDDLDREPFVSLKYFWRFFDLPSVNGEIELDLSWRKDCIVSEILNNPEIPANPAAGSPIVCIPETVTSNARYKINSTKLAQSLHCI